MSLALYPFIRWACPATPSAREPSLLQPADPCALFLQACLTDTYCDCGYPRVWTPLWTLAWTPFRHSCLRDGLHNGNALEPKRTSGRGCSTVCRGPSTALDARTAQLWVWSTQPAAGTASDCDSSISKQPPYKHVDRMGIPEREIYCSVVEIFVLLFNRVC